ncbi:MAG: alkaline phosphatase family protein [Stenotrophobium sp.]
MKTYLERTWLLLITLFFALVTNATASGIPRYDHVVIVIEENTSSSTIYGNTSAPYINSLKDNGVYFTQSFAVTHPSEPNYLALFSGSTQGLTDDSCPYTFSGDNLGNQLIAAGFTFTGYSENMPSNGYTDCASGNYARKHNPWVNFSDLSSSVNLTYASFPTDFTTLPTLSFVIPDLCNDMHDCSTQTGDTWLQNNIDAYAQWAKTNNSLLIVTWDEDDSSTTANQIATIFYGAQLQNGAYAETSANGIDHYSVLRTLEDMYGLAALGSAASRTPITDVWGSGGSSGSSSGGSCSSSSSSGSSSSSSGSGGSSGGSSSSSGSSGSSSSGSSSGSGSSSSSSGVSSSSSSGGAVSGSSSGAVGGGGAMSLPLLLALLLMRAYCAVFRRRRA